MPASPSSVAAGRDEQPAALERANYRNSSDPVQMPIRHGWYAYFAMQKKAPPISKWSQHLSGVPDPKIKNMVAADEGGGNVDCQLAFVAGGGATLA